MEKFTVFPHVQVDVGVAAHISFFKIALCNFDVAQNLLHSLHKKSRFVGTGHVRLGYDFDERRAGAVVVDI